VAAPPNKPRAPLSKHRADALVLASSVNASVRRSTVSQKQSHLDYDVELRWDFWFHCAYCTISEAEAGALRFTVDHYLPVHRYPELALDYGNLMWACDMCNSIKGTGPSEAAARKGLRFLRVDTDDPEEHIASSALSPDRVEHLTADVGEYTIQRLNLNREPLRKLRNIRARISKSADVIRRGIRALQGQQIQDLSPKARGRFLEARDAMCARGLAATNLIDEALVREMNRSVVIDPPASCDQDAAKRKAYLSRVNAPMVTIKSSP
jgi:hypothetical protein